MLEEAQRLYQLGFAVHWIKKNSKAPVKKGWAESGRDGWDEVEKGYRDGYGLGVRLGDSSKIGDRYLANLDVDIKSSNPRHRREALKLIDEHFPGIIKSAPYVKTGYGYRFFVALKHPQKSFTLGSSPDKTVVLMPTAEINLQQRSAIKEGLITEDQLKAGYRVRAAWEVDLMSSGKQVVLPPSIHPETKKPYIWKRGFSDISEIPLVEPKSKPSAKADVSQKAGKSFTPVPVDLVTSSLSDDVYRAIVEGEGVEDRSAAAFSATMSMIRAGFSDQEIMTVLTDKDNFLGEVAYDHRKTKNRSNAASWVYDYCIRKARKETSLDKVFSDEVVVTPLISEAVDIEKQKTDALGEKRPDNWKRKIERYNPKDGEIEGRPRPTLKNTILILQNAICKDVFKRDLFKNRDFYSCDVPWVENAKGRAIEDDDAAHIVQWMSEKYRFEPEKNKVFDAITVIAVKNAFHPVRDILDRLPAWDGVPRLDTWLEKHFDARVDRSTPESKKASEDYLAQVFRKWLVASVTRVYEPGAKFDWMLLLQGAQGTGKSSFGSVLFSDQFFSDWLPPLSDKDAALGLQGVLCVEFGELDHLRRGEVETTKAFITRRIDKVRPPYGRKMVEIERQCVFFGTTNRDQYFKDDTGNRRFNPVEVGRLDFLALKRDREQLWAEAVFIYKNGLEEHLYLEGAAELHARDKQSDKMVSDEADIMAHEFEEFITREAVKKEGEGFNFDRFRLLDLFREGMGPFQKWSPSGRNIHFATKSLRKMGGSIRKIQGRHYWRIEQIEALPPLPFPGAAPHTHPQHQYS